ncbi:DUF4336 domain-containing protein [Photobacterium nomapromontoriensis]|uniref:DUF4336 domain-containing protein n=1 Tax=Photobacterium nomapromontoriensis TaxID=2910237 RepID=UPI003D0BE576
MIEVGHNLWVFDGTSVTFLTLPFSTRMTVIKLSDSTLWVHSPIELTDKLKSQVNSLGEVKYVIAPNHLHHLFLKAWQDAYPEAKTYGTSEVIKKRDDLRFDGTLASGSEYPWMSDISQFLFTGSPLMEECVFFHHESRSLIVTDLIENFPPSDFTRTQRLLAKFTGILSPNGKTPIDWRMSFMFHKREAREHYSQMVEWQPTRIIMAHGEIVNADALTFLRKSFGWLKIK